jgi:hypothetical protein
MPKEKYATREEIFEHSQRIGSTTTCTTRPLPDAGPHGRSLGRGPRPLARAHQPRRRPEGAVRDHGARPASRPKLPGIPGIEDFEGHSFHTSRWDYAYTGGDTDGRHDGLADKRVGIIGTGATAIQCVPRLAEYAQHLYVFQRTPSSVDLRATAHRPEWVASLEPGWQRERRENFGAIRPPGIPWRRTWSTTAGPTSSAASCAEGHRPAAHRGRVARDAGRAGRLQKMEADPRRVDDEVPTRDRRGAQALVPQLCKRPRSTTSTSSASTGQRHARGRERGQGRRAHHREGRGRQRQSSTRSTASSTRPASRSPRVQASHRLRHQRSRRRVAVRPLVRRAARRCTGSPPGASRTGSTSASRRTRSA